MKERTILIAGLVAIPFLCLLLVCLIALVVNDTTPSSEELPLEDPPIEELIETTDPPPTETAAATPASLPSPTATPTLIPSPTFVPGRPPTDEPTKPPYIFKTPIIIIAPPVLPTATRAR
jgi:hypothetical protein